MSNCELCGMPMPPGEEMFKYHGNSGPCPVQSKPQHQIRVSEEKLELDEKISKLSEFLNSAGCEKVHPDEIQRLQNQLSVMKQYSDILGELIANF